VISQSVAVEIQIVQLFAFVDAIYFLKGNTQNRDRRAAKYNRKIKNYSVSPHYGKK